MADGAFGSSNFLNPLDVLEESPRSAFFSFQDQFGSSPNQRKFFQDQFNQFHNEFLGTLGQTIRSGQVPSQRFTDFLGNVNFDQRFAQQAPSQRGAFTSRFAPSTRFLFF